ncbi:MAG: enoyl-CoA hydratase/isomerase family protein [Chloroflexi bacterium]|nr:enoyl-CoA hydratase/isomerase family protein [Chloroflexota bacterium]
MADGNEAVLFETRGHVALLTLNRPEAMNAMNRDLGRALAAGLARVAEDGGIRAAILTGAGRAFCAGADLKERAAGGDSGAAWHDVEGFVYGRATEAHPKPLIAAINGHALAGGLELALRCDLLIASERAQFGLPEIVHGFFPGGGGPQRLPRMIPRPMAMEMILTGDSIDAATALRAGLVSRVVPHEMLMETAWKIANRIAEHNPVAVRAVREVANTSDDMSLPLALRFGSALRWIVGQTDAAKTGSQRWVERR